jgi:hypothetical protein
MVMSVLAVFGVAAIASSGDANAADCLVGAKSKNSTTPVTVTFFNNSGEFRSVMWADFSGNLKNYAKLNPGQSYTVNTFATHPWIFTDGPGNCVEMFVARAGTYKYTLKAKLIGSGGD